MRADLIGVDLGGTKLLIVSGLGEERSETGPDFSPEMLALRLRDFTSRRQLRPRGIGVAVPGLVDRAGRLRVCDVLPRFSGWDATSALADLGREIAVVNDVKAALAEEMHDAPAGATVGVVMAGTAIGAAFITEGRPLLGASGWAGELGYFPMMVDGAVRRLDELAGGAFIAARLRVSAEELWRLAESGDPAVLAALQVAGAALGLGLAAVINLLNPSRLAVGGGALSLPGYWNSARESAHRQSLPDVWQACTLSEVRAGERVAALGAARIAGAQEAETPRKGF